MKYIISTGYSVITDIGRKSGITVSFTAGVDSDSAKVYDTFGDAMKVCDTVNNLLSKYAFKVMTLNE